jgi:competence ComEA-like helix-hairpin-helix protein
MKIPFLLSRTLNTLLAFAIVFFAFNVHAEKNPPSKPIDLNVANIKELQELPGVGAVTAQRIIDLRQKSGRFHRVEDLLAVRGISQKKTGRDAEVHHGFRGTCGESYFQENCSAG